MGNANIAGFFDTESQNLSYESYKSYKGGAYKQCFPTLFDHKTFSSPLPQKWASHKMNIP